MEKKIYEITIKDEVTYVIKAESQEDAEDLAFEWFSEREPEAITKVVTEEEVNTWGGSVYDIDDDEDDEWEDDDDFDE